MIDKNILVALSHVPTQAVGESVWKVIISGLLDDFERFIGEEFERDLEPSVNVQHQQFSTWLWSKKRSARIISAVLWSGVIAGSLATDENGRDTFVITADIFLFHSEKQERLVTNRGQHFMQFQFEQSDGSEGKWRYLGWVKDEWNEWEDVSYSIE